MARCGKEANLQEDIERRTIAVAVTATKITSQTLAKALQSALQQIEQAQRKARTPQGRQSVSKLMNHGVNTNSIPLNGNTRIFDRVARKKHVDYAFYKIESKKYLLFFKSGQADAITQCFAEYTKRIMKKDNRPSVRKQLRQVTTSVWNRPREREQKREAVHGDR